jgi:hypothetical protein
MASTCQYHDGGRYVHPQAAATHVAIRRPRDGPWDVYDAVSRGSRHTPEFCLGHAMDVADARNQAPRQAPAAPESPAPLLHVCLSLRARKRAEALLGVMLPWTCVLPSRERHASGGAAAVTQAQYDQIQHLPGVRRLRDPWPVHKEKRERPPSDGRRREKETS